MSDFFGRIAAIGVNLVLGTIVLGIMIWIGPKTVIGMLDRANGIFES